MRILLRVLAPLLALAVAALGAFVVLETGWAWARPAEAPLALPWSAWRTTLEGWTWTAVPIRLFGAGLVIVGLLLLVLALSAGRREVRLTSPAPEITITTSPGSLARLVGHQVRGIDHVASASVTATPRKVTVRATSRQPADEATSDIAQRVCTLLSELPLDRPPRVSVAVSRTETLS